VPKNRLEGFSDGIFAFAATLLILNLAVTETRPLGPQLLEIWTSYVAYAISFMTIGIIWINHHTVMHQISHVDRTFLTLSVLFLMVIAFIPFPTRLLALYIRSDGAEAAALAYGITLTLTAILFNAIWRYAAWEDGFCARMPTPRWSRASRAATSSAPPRTSARRWSRC